MGLETPLDRFMETGGEFPDLNDYTGDDLVTLHDMIVDEVNLRGFRLPCR